MRVPVYSLFEYIFLEPIYAIIGLSLLFLAYTFVWKCTFGLFLLNSKDPEGFLGVWSASARFLLFWLLFFFLGRYFLATKIYVPDPDGLAILHTIKKNPEILQKCAKHLRLIENGEKPALVWIDVLRLCSCRNREEARMKFGEKYKSSEKSISDAIKQFENIQ